MQFSSALVLLASAAGALAAPSGPVATTPTPVLRVTNLGWNVQDNNLSASFDITNSVQDASVHCQGSSTNFNEKFTCEANKDIQFQFVSGGNDFPFQWFEVFQTFAPGVLANDGNTYLADGVNSLPDAKCTQGCSVQSLVMQGRTTVVTK
ncbi:Crotonase core [Botryosphaeria dothidea]|uniref:Crotonase core n=1 Tax=Botryosphaeria dothidea TaxID=55169 RepID=A0A8H4NCL6_9PEZI|nr:Crotonase core [Botryosphaeria dothidea]